MRGSLALVGALGVLSVSLFHCGKTADTPADAGPSNENNNNNDDGGTSTSTKDAGGTGLTDASLDKDAGALGDGAPPEVSCAQDASACDGLPASVCADTNTLLYFSDGACVDGKCTWQKNLKPCGIQSYCYQGGCTPPTTK